MHILIITADYPNKQKTPFKAESAISVIKAFSIDEAVRLISAVQFDLVFYDLAFPENFMSENLKQLSSICGRIPLVALADSMSDPAIKEALIFGADYHMAKDQLQFLSGVESFKVLLLKDAVNYN